MSTIPSPYFFSGLWKQRPSPHSTYLLAISSSTLSIFLINLSLNCMMLLQFLIASQVPVPPKSFMGQFLRILKNSQSYCPHSCLEFRGFLRTPSTSFSKPVAALILENSRNSRMRMRILENEVSVGIPNCHRSMPH